MPRREDSFRPFRKNLTSRVIVRLRLMRHKRAVMRKEIQMTKTALAEPGRKWSVEAFINYWKAPYAPRGPCL
jgi:hypothetical protein